MRFSKEVSSFLTYCMLVVVEIIVVVELFIDVFYCFLLQQLSEGHRKIEKHISFNNTQFEGLVAGVKAILYVCSLKELVNVASIFKDLIFADVCIRNIFRHHFLRMSKDEENRNSARLRFHEASQKNV